MMSDAAHIALFLVSLGLMMAMVMTLIRAIKGPTLYDRILAVNAMGTLTVGLVAVLGFVTKRPEFLDIAMVYALINFVATIAILRFIEERNLG